MKELKMYSSEYIMNTPMKPIEYCVDGLISQGLFILADLVFCGAFLTL